MTSPALSMPEQIIRWIGQDGDDRRTNMKTGEVLMIAARDACFAERNVLHIDRILVGPKKNSCLNGAAA